MSYQKHDIVFFHGHRGIYWQPSAGPGVSIIQFNTAYLREHFPEAERLAQDSFIQGDNFYLWVSNKELCSRITTNKQASYLLKEEF